jgi:hypothetical protein
MSVPLIGHFGWAFGCLLRLHIANRLTVNHPKIIPRTVLGQTLHGHRKKHQLAAVEYHNLETGPPSCALETVVGFPSLSSQFGAAT